MSLPPEDHIVLFFYAMCGPSGCKVCIADSHLTEMS